jgi:dynein heavy chain
LRTQKPHIPKQSQHSAEKAAVSAFFEPSGPAALRWYYHVPEEKDKDGAYVAKGTRPQLLLSTSPQHGDRLAAAGRCFYFVRVNPRGVGERTLDADMAAGEVTGPSALDAVRALVSDVYLPVLQDQGAYWGKMAPEHAKEFLDGAGAFCFFFALVFVVCGRREFWGNIIT